MKTSRFIKNALILAFISIFAGCSNLLDSKEESAAVPAAKKGELVISLGLKSPGARAIRAFDYSISDIARWTLTLTDESDSSKIISLITDAETSENSPSATYTYSNSTGTITATKIPAGTYTVSLEGTFTKESTSYTISGSASKVAIGADSSGKAAILLGPKSTGTGSISLTFTDSNQSISNLASNLKITLTSLSDSTNTYTYEPNSSSNTLTFDSSSLVLSGSGIKSGWYKISFSAGDSYRVYLPDEPDQFVEIADGTETAATTAIAAESGKVYYTTNDSSSYNGLSSSSRANLTTLLSKFNNGGLSEEGNIYIHFDTQLYFADTDLLNSFKEQVGKNNKKVVFYDNEGNEALLITGDGEGNTTTTLKGTTTFFSKNDEAATFKINAFDLSTNIRIFLYAGTMIDASSVTSYSSNYRLTFVFDTSSGENNFSAYDSSIDGAKPFLTAGADLSSYIILYDSENSQTATDYTVVSTSSTNDAGTTIYNHYVQAVGSAGITAELFKEKISIRAAYSSDSSTAYATDTAIPYTNSDLKFGLYEKTTSTDSDESTTEDYTAWSDENATYAWYLNGNDLKMTTSTASFNPYEDSNINISGTNTVSCKVTISDATYVAEMSFTFTGTARSAAVWFDGINKSSTDYYALKQLADNTSTEATASELASDYSSTANITPLYCFDTDCNLWVAAYNSANSAASFSLIKYQMNEKSGLFDTDLSTLGSFGVTKGTPVDVYYASIDDFNCIFVLSVDSKTGYIYAISTDKDFFVPATGFLLSSGTVTPMQIAVDDGKIYIAGSDNKIYPTTVDLTYNGGDEDNLVTLGTLSDPVDSNALSTYAPSDHLSITDLQVGDGLGNDSTTLYALLRDYYIYSDGGTNGFKCYSRGALVAIDTSSSTANPYGWPDASMSILYSSSVTGTLYAPTSTTITDEGGGFYGPTRFVAVVPKKLVILDDGVYFDGTNGKVANQDSLVEFDIEEKSLSRGASVSATAVIASGFTVSN